MGLTDYISRNPHGAAKPINMYDEDFVIAQIDAINKTINAIKQRGSPRKFPNLESQDDYKPPNKTSIIKRPRGRPRKLTLQSQDDSRIKAQSHDDSKIKVPRTQSRKRKTKDTQKQNKCSLRKQPIKPNLENRVTRNHVIEQKVTQQAIAKSHLPINTNNNQSLTQIQNTLEMQTDQDPTTSTPPKSPEKSPLSFTTYLSPNKEETITPSTTNTTLDNAIKDVFSSTSH